MGSKREKMHGRERGVAHTREPPDAAAAASQPCPYARRVELTIIHTHHVDCMWSRHRSECMEPDWNGSTAAVVVGRRLGGRPSIDGSSHGCASPLPRCWSNHAPLFLSLFSLPRSCVSSSPS